MLCTYRWTDTEQLVGTFLQYFEYAPKPGVLGNLIPTFGVEGGGRAVTTFETSFMASGYRYGAYFCVQFLYLMSNAIMCLCVYVLKEHAIRLGSDKCYQ